MAKAEKGNRARVMNRWQGGLNTEHRTPRKPFKGEAQFKLDDVYISPFTHKRAFDGAGRMQYVPLTPNMTPTGIRIFDEYLQALQAGKADIGDFCARHNAKTSDLDGLVFLLTGIANYEFRSRWIVRCADELLRYTDIGIPEVARRSGAGSRTNLYFIYERELNCSPTARRNQLRQADDLGRYKIENPMTASS